MTNSVVTFLMILHLIDKRLCKIVLEIKRKQYVKIADSESEQNEDFQTSRALLCILFILIESF